MRAPEDAKRAAAISAHEDAVREAEQARLRVAAEPEYGSCSEHRGFTLLPLSGSEENPLFKNLGGGKFVEVGAALGVGVPWDGRGLATGDLDGDGDLDLVLGNAYKPAIAVFRNDARARGRSLTLRLRGAGSNRFAIGARVVVETAQGEEAQELACGGSFLSCDPAELHFGLGSAERARLSIRWPSGKTTRLEDVPHGLVTVTEGKGGFEHARHRAPAGPPPATPPRFLRAGDRFEARLVAPDGAVIGSGALEGRTTVVEVWTPRGASCTDPAARLAALLELAKGRDVTWLSVAVDDREAARQALGSLDLPLHGTLDRGALLHPTEGFVPVYLLVGPDGRVRERRVGILDAEELARMLARHSF